MQHLAAPQLAPKFEPFVTGPGDDAAYIGDRTDKREYMARNDLVEYDKGVAPEAPSEREQMNDVIADIKRFRDTDTDYWHPDLKPQKMGEGALDGAPEVSADDIEVIK